MRLRYLFAGFATARMAASLPFDPLLRHGPLSQGH